MDTLRADKKARNISAAEAAAMVKPGMWLDLGGVNAQSETFDKALAARRDELTDVNIRSCLSLPVPSRAIRCFAVWSQMQLS